MMKAVLCINAFDALLQHQDIAVLLPTPLCIEEDVRLRGSAICCSVGPMSNTPYFCFAE